MNNLEFVNSVAKVPVTFDGSRIGVDQLNVNITNCIKAIDLLKITKKDMFSENHYRPINQKGFFNNCSSLPAQFADYEDGKKVMSAILNIVVEGGEMLKLLQKTLKARGELNSDIYNRTGNLFQHIAGLSEYMNTNFEEMMNDNIDKLKNMHPERFK